MLTALLLLSAGFVFGLGAWWFSLDRRRGKEARHLAQAHHLHVDAVHGAYVRALRYGFVEDFTFLVRKAHPRADGEKVFALRPEWRINQEKVSPFSGEDKKRP
jgi:hypothetical protein